MFHNLHEALGHILQQPEAFGMHAIRLTPAPLEIDWQGEQAFPAASVIKAPLLLNALKQVELGKLELSQRIELRGEDQVGGAGVLGLLEPGLRPSLLDLLRLMIIISDNTATNLVLDTLGGREVVNAWLAELGFTKTRVVGKLMLPDHLKNAEQRAGQKASVSPKEIAQLLALLWQGDVLGPKMRQLALEILSEQQYREMLSRYLPEEALVASKSGSINGTRNDVGIVRYRETTYAVAICSQGIADHREWVDNAGTLGVAKISRLVFEQMVGA